jgi:hypothetical protein
MRAAKEKTAGLTSVNSCRAAHAGLCRSFAWDEESLGVFSYPVRQVGEDVVGRVGAAFQGGYLLSAFLDDYALARASSTL